MDSGHLRTSSNYNTEEKKIVGGKNGFGFKLVLIWPFYGRIETVDHIRGLKYVQEFHDNLNVLSKPVITELKSQKSYIKVTVKPDYIRLGITGLTPDIISLLHTKIFDIGAITDQNVKRIKMIYNNETIQIKNFQQYIDMYIGKKDVSKRVYGESGDRWEFAVTLSPTHQLEQILFVYSICTTNL